MPGLKPRREQGESLWWEQSTAIIHLFAVWFGLWQFRLEVVKLIHVEPLWKMTSFDRCIMGDFISIGHLVNFYKYEERLKAAGSPWTKVVVADTAPAYTECLQAEHLGLGTQSCLKRYIDFVGEAHSFNWVMAPLRVKSDRSHWIIIFWHSTILPFSLERINKRLF